MIGIRFARGRRLWLPVALAGLLVLDGSLLAASDSPGPAETPNVRALDKTSRNSPPEVVKPVIPGKAELAESAYKKLDPTEKGYVAKDDARGLEGFEPIFDQIDTKRTGKLNFSQFKEAWRQYTTGKYPSSGKAAGE